jgi:hypothetical protein
MKPEENYYRRKDVITKMKKSLILIAIALMVLVPVFSEEKVKGELGYESKTDVVTEVDLQPEYYYTVTAAALDTESVPGDLVDQKTITLTRAENSKRLSDSDTYYVSYKFIENKPVNLKIKLSGYMLPVKSDNTEDTTRSGNDKNKIPLTVTVAVNQDSYDATVFPEGSTPDHVSTESVTLTSAGTKEATVVSYKTASNTVGDTRWNSAALNIKQTEDSTLDGVELGKYLATITLITESAQ